MLRKQSDCRLAARDVPSICDAMDLLGELPCIDATDEEKSGGVNQAICVRCTGNDRFDEKRVM
jgi:hypothetical protein